MRYYFLLFSILISITSAECSKAPIKIACVGASNTYGYKLQNREHNSYPAQLQMLLGDSYIVKNFGVNGATVMKKGTLPYWDTIHFQEVLRFQPDIIIFIDMGGNDFELAANRPFLEDHFLEDYAALIMTFRSLKSSTKFIMAYPVAEDAGILFDAIDHRAKTYNMYSISVADLHKDRDNFFFNDVHYSKKGCKQIARSMYDFIIETDFQ